MTDYTLLRGAQSYAKRGILFAPSGFVYADIEILKDVCNGCGAANSWFKPPSTIYGTSIQSACMIHDWMYNEGTTIEDKHQADRVFLNNMLRLIERDSDKWYKPSKLQRIRAFSYYKAVNSFGGPAFWVNKN